MTDTVRLTAALAGRYAIERELGHGGMATVYLAHDVRHDRDVVLKVLHPKLAAVLGAARFLQEIRISVRLDHPNILTLIDSGESDGFLWYVLPYVRGESLRDKLTRGRQLSVEETVRIATQVASALDYAHRQGSTKEHLGTWSLRSLPSEHLSGTGTLNGGRRREHLQPRSRGVRRWRRCLPRPGGGGDDVNTPTKKHAGVYYY